MLLFFGIGENTPVEPEIPELEGLVLVVELSLKYEDPLLALELDTIDDQP